MTARVGRDERWIVGDARNTPLPSRRRGHRLRSMLAQVGDLRGNVHGDPRIARGSIARRGVAYLVVGQRGWRSTIVAQDLLILRGMRRIAEVLLRLVVQLLEGRRHRVEGVIAIRVKARFDRVMIPRA